MAALDSRIDELYQKPLDEFTAARNALAKTVADDDAERIRKLPKPTVVPWVVNQLYWRERPVYDRLRKSGERLRAAQIAALKGRSSDLRTVADAHRNAIGEASQHALRISAQAGAKPNPDELARTLEALSLAPALPETAGRLTRPLQPAGFEALAGVVPAAISGHPKPEREGAQHGRQGAERRPEGDTQGGRAEAARARQAAAMRRQLENDARRAEADVKEAEAELERAAAAESKARQSWERAKQALADVRARLEASQDK